MYNIRIITKNMKAKYNQESIISKLQSATAYIEAIQELYQRNVRRSQRREARLEFVQLLQAVGGMLHEIRREVLLRELTSVLHDETVPAATKKEKVVKIFQLLA
jgi:sulfite reductase beta subunit-like hemoprotein